MPVTETETKTLSRMKKEYGEKKGKQVFFALRNKDKKFDRAMSKKAKAEWWANRLVHLSSVTKSTILIELKSDPQLAWWLDRTVKAEAARAYPLNTARDMNIPPTSHEAFYNGFSIIIENPVGSKREWTDASTGEKGSTTFIHPYGYFTDSMGHDGDEVDCYLGPDELSPWAFVVKQLRIDTGKFDESKIMMGFHSEDEAKTAYLKHYDKPGFFGGITRWHVDALRRALEDSKHNPAIIKARLRFHAK